MSVLPLQWIRRKFPNLQTFWEKQHSGRIILPGNTLSDWLKEHETYSTDLILNDSPDWKHSEADRKLQRETLMRAYALLEELAAVDQKILDARDTLKNREVNSQGVCPEKNKKPDCSL